MRLNIDKWKDWLDRKLTIRKYIAFDIETTGLDIFKDKIHLFSYDLNGKKGVIHIRPDLKTKQKIPKDVRRALEDEDTVVIMHSGGQFDSPMFRLKTGIHIRNIWDTQIVEQVLLAGIYKVDPYNDTNLANTLFRRFGITLDKSTRQSFIGYDGPITTKQDRYAIKDISLLHRLALAQLRESQAVNLDQTIKLENLTCEVTAELRFNGIGFDENFWMEVAEATEEEYKSRIAKLPKEVTNWNSEKQIKAYFWKRHGIKIETLKEIPDVDNKILKQFKHARELYKASTSYGFKFLLRGKRKPVSHTLDSDGRIRCVYGQIMETGRYSTSNPNLQNIPAYSIRGFAHRWAFIPKSGWVFCVGDFTGQELGIIAAGSKERTWIEAMLKGHDLHSVLAAQMFPEWDSIGIKGCTFPFKCKCPEHVKRRRPIKDLNFGLAYGKGAVSYAKEAGISLNEAYRIIRKYKKRNPRVIAWLERNGKHAIKHSAIRTPPPFERLRKVQGEDWKKKNRGKNTPVQGGGADMMKLAMCMIYDYIYSNNLSHKCRMVLTVHDELLIEAKESYAPKVCKWMKFFMEEAAMIITIDRLITTDPEIMIQWELKDKDRKTIEREWKLDSKKSLRNAA